MAEAQTILDEQDTGGEGEAENSQAGGAGGNAGNGDGAGAGGAADTGTGAGADAGESGSGDGGTGDGAGSSSAGEAMPETWRQIIAGGDEKKLAQLNRYSTFDKFSESVWSAREQLRQGLKHQPLGENPSDEEVAEFREANGIPEAADKYELSLKDGLTLSEDDKAILKPILEAAHGQNATPAQVSAMTNAFFEQRELETQALASQDQSHIEEVSEILREDWGSDYRTNMGVMKNFVSRVPETIREAFSGARMADGRGLLNSPEFVKFAVDLERMVNPAATVVPNTVDPGKSIDAELHEIRELMRTDRAAYDRDEAKQARYRELLDAKARLK